MRRWVRSWSTDSSVPKIKEGQDGGPSMFFKQIPPISEHFRAAESDGLRYPKPHREGFSHYPVYHCYPHHLGIGSRKSPPQGISPSFSFIICISRRQFKNFSSSTPRQHRARWNSNSYS